MKKCNVNYELFKKDYKKMSFKELKDKYNISNSTIYRIAKYLDITKTCTNKFENIDISNFKEDRINMSINKLCAKYNISLITLNKIIKHLRLSPKRHKKDGINCEEFKKDYTTMSLLKLAGKYNISIGTAMSLTKDLNLKSNIQIKIKKRVIRNRFNLINHEEFKKDFLNMTYLELANKYKVSITSIYIFASKLNIQKEK